MPDVQILQRGVGHQLLDLVTGKIAAPSRVVAIPPTVEHAELEMGDQYLQLPQWSPATGGPMAFRMSAGDGGATITGMGGPSTIETTEWGLLGALIIIICTAGTITVSAEDEDSPEGSRFASGLEIAPGTAQMFICSSVDGVKKWFPVAYTASP